MKSLLAPIVIESSCSSFINEPFQFCHDSNVDMQKKSFCLLQVAGLGEVLGIEDYNVCFEF